VMVAVKNVSHYIRDRAKQSEAFSRSRSRSGVNPCMCM
jgi:hypothetical protein